jgi:hypothetical protein
VERRTTWRKTDRVETSNRKPHRFSRRNFPGDERAVREIGCEQRLSHATTIPARNIAAMRAMTTSTSTPAAAAISANGSRTKPSICSSEIARILALIDRCVDR